MIPRRKAKKPPPIVRAIPKKHTHDETTVSVSHALSGADHTGRATLGQLPMLVGAVTVPATYDSATGIVVDLSATFATALLFMSVQPSALPAGTVLNTTVVVDSPSAGKGTVRLYRARYDKATHPTADAGGLPASVSATGTIANVANESAHTHGVGTLANGIPSVNANPIAGAAANAASGGHGHAISGSTAAGATHTHQDAKLYTHTHSLTQTATDAAEAEVGNGTSLAGLTMRYLAVGTL